MNSTITEWMLPDMSTSVTASSACKQDIHTCVHPDWRMNQQLANHSVLNIYHKPTPKVAADRPIWQRSVVQQAGAPSSQALKHHCTAKPPHGPAMAGQGLQCYRRRHLSCACKGLEVASKVARSAVALPSLPAKQRHAMQSELTLLVSSRTVPVTAAANHEQSASMVRS